MSKAAAGAPRHPLPERVVEAIRGQASLLEGVERALRAGTLAHAYLILGARGAGRGRLATAIAQMALCTVEPNGCTVEPQGCGRCPDCKQARRLAHPDLQLLYPATKEEEKDAERGQRLVEEYAADRFRLLGASPTASIGIDQVRGLKEAVAKSRVSGPRRVAIVFDAGRLTEQAGQSALKLVEEPPPDTLLLLTAEDTASLLPTLVSRCQRLRVRALPREEVAGLLEQELAVPPREARLLANLSGGSLGRAIEMLSEGLLELRDRIVPLVSAPLSDARAVEQAIARFGGPLDAATGQRAVELLLLWHRDLLAARSGVDPARWVHADRAGEIEQAARRMPLKEVRRRIELLEEFADALAHRVNPELSLHAALARIGSGASAGELWP
ncbi:MAG: hypothetical protein IT349_19025 [Candidatus Eisenbacteria bacterium]|nr:hypothetical protein [Candidatus Eisenbacteria bacterium]